MSNLFKILLIYLFISTFIICKSFAYPEHLFDELRPKNGIKNERKEWENEQKPKICMPTIKRENEAEFDEAKPVEQQKKQHQIGAVKCEKMEICEDQQENDQKIDQRNTKSICSTEIVENQTNDSIEESSEQISHENSVGTSSRKIFVHSQKEKMEIVDKFMKMKKELSLANPKKPYEEINKKITDKLGVSIRTISLWKRELGIEKVLREYSVCEKNAMVKQFDKMKEDWPDFGSDKICKMLKVSKSSIFAWKNQLKNGQLNSKLTENSKTLDEKEKKEIVKNYEKLRKESDQWTEREIAKKLKINQNKLLALRKEWQMDFKKRYSMEEKQKIIEIFDKMLGKKVAPITQTDKLQIAGKVGLHLKTIDKWKTELGIKITKECERFALVKEYYQIKRDNPKVPTKQIAKKFNMSKGNLFYWKKQFDEKAKANESADGGQLSGCDMPTPSRDDHLAANEQNAWKWNKCTSKRSRSRKRKLCELYGNITKFKNKK